jgi:hypothetical protein
MSSEITKILSTHPPTITLSTRLDGRTVATLTKFWASQGERITSISELTRITIEMFTDLLKIQGLAEEVKTQEEAMAIIQESGLRVKTQPRELASAILHEDGGSMANILLKKMQVKINSTPLVNKSQVDYAQEELTKLLLMSEEEKLLELKRNLAIVPPTTTLET